MIRKLSIDERRYKTICRLAVLCLAALMITSCVTPPSNPENLCSIFSQKRGWHKDALQSQRRWGSSPAVMMAIMYQESRYIDDAKPPRKRFLGIPLWWRISSSYGYSQAKDGTWDWYERSVGRNADRDDFDDAIDFIGWYNKQSNQMNGISLTDPYSLYLAYHEGHGGYRAGSYREKAWLLQVAGSVRDRAARYDQQLRSCK